MQNNFDDLQHTSIVTIKNNYSGKMSTIQSYVKIIIKHVDTIT